MNPFPITHLPRQIFLPPMQLNLMDLPNEIILHILSFTPLKSWFNFEKTCKQLHVSSHDLSLKIQSFLKEFFEFKQSTEQKLLPFSPHHSYGNTHNSNFLIRATHLDAWSKGLEHFEKENQENPSARRHENLVIFRSLFDDLRKQFDRAAGICEGVSAPDFTGKGKITYANGDVYEGDIFKSEQHGEGRKVCANQIIYEGRFTNGTFRHGKKMMPNGSLEEGQFHHNKLHGQGKRTFRGMIEEGNFLCGKLRNQGKKTFPSGAIEEGNFLGGAFVGPGTKHLADGTIEEGEFANGKLRGPGKRILSDGTIEEGYFNNGNLHGKGRRILPDGSKEIGYFYLNKLCE